ncbi:MAG: MBL fold metallo-hydrolase [Planctomycetaceae bacterium]
MLAAGPYTCHAILSGTFALDGGAMFGVVPRALWQRGNPPDDKHRIPLALRLLLVAGKERTFLVDTGIGEKFGEKENRIYDVRAMLPDQALRGAGFDPARVTDVVLTHFHFDHGGGSTRRDGSIVFPKARHHVQRAHWEYAQAPLPKDRASFRPADFLPLERAGLLVLHDGPSRLAKGIEVEPLMGHTDAMQVVKVSGGGTTLLYLADLAPTTSHLRLPWIMGYDNRPLVTLEEKTRLFSAAADGGWILFFEHDPLMAACRIVRDDDDFAAGPEVTI